MGLISTITHLRYCSKTFCDNHSCHQYYPACRCMRLKIMHFFDSNNYCGTTCPNCMTRYSGVSGNSLMHGNLQVFILSTICRQQRQLVAVINLTTTVGPCPGLAFEQILDHWQLAGHNHNAMAITQIVSLSRPATRVPSNQR